MPNIPLRICEMVLGRLSLRELVIITPIHFVCALSSVMMLRLLLPESLSSLAISPIIYSDDNPWMVVSACAYSTREEPMLNMLFCACLTFFLSLL